MLAGWWSPGRKAPYERESEFVDLRPIRVLSLCSGAGGLDLGVRLAIPTARVVCYVEHEAYACAVLVSRMAEEALDSAPLWSDLRTFDGRPWRGAVDLVVGGYPCQPFSTAGSRKGTEDPRHLWPHVARILRECGAPWLFVENVRGHVSLGLDVVYAELLGMGFRPEGGIFAADEVGAPHRRERLFVLAHADSGRRDGADAHLRPTSAGGRGAEALLDAPGICVGLADAARDGREPRGLGHSDGAGLEGRREPIACGADARVAGAAGPEGVHDGRSPGHEAWPATFPPRPRELAAWAELLTVDPSLEPALCRMADGVAERVERLRLLGNGVVPLQAAHALLYLISRFSHTHLEVETHVEADAAQPEDPLDR